MRVPVVASAAAVKDIDAIPDRDLPVASDSESFCKAIVTLPRSPTVGERFAAAGLACVELHHNWDIQQRRLESVVVGEPPVSGVAPRPGALQAERRP